VSPEGASLAFGETMLTNPNATGSYYLQGELLGEVLDAAIRDSTRERRTLDDVMRALYARSAAGRGFTSFELVAIIDSLCSCRLDDFFAASVRGAAPIDLTPVVRRLGWRLAVDTAPAADDRGTPLPDLRLSGIAVDSGLALVVNPRSQWAEAGFVSGDLLLNMNGSRPRSFSELYRALHALHVGDSVTMTVQRGGTRRRVAMVLRSYDRPRVRLVDLDSVSTMQRERRARWLAGW
jgi:predicted metalloprotease with PDZ domain